MPDHPDYVAVLVVHGQHIIATLKLPTGILFWDLFSRRCSLVPSELEEGDILQDLADMPGIKFLDLEEFCLMYASEFSPQA